ncbi:MAG: TonB-dependent receptor [Cellvibrionaceae bacterium]|nr:TonB-dependent receptor [Cellvibrionaceae bacterium]
MSVSENIKTPKKLLYATLATCYFTSATAAEIEEVVVAGIFQRSLQDALEIKRQSNKVADAISAKDLGSFPSENIAEAIQRIPGVQISNVNGRGAMISIRGLGPQFSETTLNGQAFKSADFTSGFRFDIIQTELATGIEVIKSPSADMDAGGLAGTININTAKPLDFSETQRLFSAKAQQSEFAASTDITPKMNVTYIDQFADDTLGILLNAGYQRLDDRVDNFWVARWLQDDQSNDYARRVRLRRIDRETERLMLNAGVQWYASDNFELGLNAVYAADSINQDLNQQVFLLFRDYSNIEFSQLENGYYRQVDVSNSLLENNRQLEDRDLQSRAITADFKWLNDAWAVNGIAHYTGGRAEETETAAILGVLIPEIRLNMARRDDVLFSTPGTDLASAELYTHRENQPLLRNEYPNGAYRVVDSSETALQLDVQRELQWGIFNKFSGGLKYRGEEFERDTKRRDRYVYGEAEPEDLPPMSEFNFQVRDFANGEMRIPHAWIAPDIQAYESFLQAEGVEIPLRQIYQDSYALERDIFASYLKADFEWQSGALVLRGDVGVRYETTERNLTSNLTGPAPENDGEARTLLGQQENNFDYSNLLPSLNTVLELGEQVQLRFAAAEVLVRPIITRRTSLAPTEQTSVEGEQRVYTVNLGQPDLKPLTAEQVDLGLEWYYGASAGLTLNLFYKSVQNGSVSQVICPAQYRGVALSGGAGSDCLDANGDSYQITSTFNADDTTAIEGYEVGVQQGLDGILPLAGFGLIANYTHISADNDADGFRLADLSEETWNITGYWENDAISVRAALNHRSPYLQPDSAASFFAREGRMVDGRDQVDVSAIWQFNDNLKFNLGALNIFSNNEEAYRDSHDVFQTLSVLGTHYYVGFSYQF